MLPILLSAAALAAAPAPTPTPVSTTSSYLSTPQWVARPDASDLSAVYPQGALLAGIQGEAVLRCEVVAQGRLARCKVAAERPAGVGFGEGALRLAPKFQMTATLPDGRSTAGGTVTIPILFQPPHD